METDLSRQIGFLLETDKLKEVVRLNQLAAGNRRETTAEHCWHVILQTLTLAEHAPEGTDIAHVVRLLAVHDLVEIDAGDHWVTDDNRADVKRREEAAANRLFALLPGAQAQDFKDLWLEFEACETAEARFANAMDAFHPMVLVFASGQPDPTHEPLSAETMRRTKQDHLAPFPTLWAYAQELLDQAVRDGRLLP
ncbi:HD domain-containing protein [Roseibium sediminicola]|uniref:HD domain-containing protein n=1 Tax=Roseibium sediminicola TaxID=2933272 RepID=A0ABT0GZ44_9HYPH|nr:HD domain-containing protein [Roseibium sp. CAU 1639]MCK7614702.1 HD domain-containing protein [Roseibium sp. CAU 1639]